MHEVGGLQLAARQQGLGATDICGVCVSLTDDIVRRNGRVGPGRSRSTCVWDITTHVMLYCRIGVLIGRHAGCLQALCGLAGFSGAGRPGPGAEIACLALFAWGEPKHVSNRFVEGLAMEYGLCEGIYLGWGPRPLNQDGGRPGSSYFTLHGKHAKWRVGVEMATGIKRIAPRMLRCGAVSCETIEWLVGRQGSQGHRVPIRGPRYVW